jgi:hypothetical protein
MRRLEPSFIVAVMALTRLILPASSDSTGRGVGGQAMKSLVIKRSIVIAGSQDERQVVA